MNLCSIASGSSGNCIYVGNESTHLLVDAGISKKRIEEGLLSIDIDPNKLNGILITHEHSDHISGIGVLARKYKMPIYGTVETIASILKTKNVGKIPEECFHFIKPEEAFMINDIQVNPFSMSHDASNPVCYTLSSNSKKVGVATDLGMFDEHIVKHLSDSEIILLEANHDVNMLQVGSYPYYLKQRILGNRGHLSNENAGRLINQIMHDKLKYVFLGHLSKENNFEELAYETVKNELEAYHADVLNTIVMKVAKRDRPSDFVSI